MATDESSANSRVVPVLQAGGGTASAIATAHQIESFKGPVKSYLDQIFSSLHTDPSALAASATQDATEKGFADKTAFLEYMASPASSAMAPPKQHDLSRPLSNYFISTSHNTYLSGNQLYGEATTQAYTNVLVRGCRCLEIDVWDGDSKASDGSDEEVDGKENKPSHWDRLKARAKSPHRHQEATEAQPTQTQPGDKIPQLQRSSSERGAEPRVLHGHTLTKEVSFRAVCEAIRDSAFVATDLPIIVSLEVHAGLVQQEKMVQIMKETWKGTLVNFTAKEEAGIGHLPSPDQLRKKILIKVKYTVDKNTGEANDRNDSVAGHSSDSDELSRTSTAASSTTPQKKKKASKILQGLSELGVYTRAYSFKQFEQPEAKIPTHVFSLSEQKILDMHESHGSALFNHNRSYLMRIFPSGLRINSSNVEPTFLWKQGAQMVALNWQKWDAGMMLNEGMFTGEAGWVLKPNGYHSLSGPSTQPAETPIKLQTLDLTVEVLAGQNIPLHTHRDGSHLHKTVEALAGQGMQLRPYLKFQLHVGNKPVNSKKPEAAQAQEQRESGEQFKRRSKTAKGTDPDFFGETMRWSHVTNVIEELSFLRLKIQDDKIGKDGLAAWACIRIDRLQSGYRFIHLLDAEGMQSDGVLLVKITKTLG